MHPGTQLLGATRIGGRCQIGPDTTLTDARSATRPWWSAPTVVSRRSVPARPSVRSATCAPARHWTTTARSALSSRPRTPPSGRVRRSRTCPTSGTPHRHEQQHRRASVIANYDGDHKFHHGRSHGLGSIHTWSHPSPCTTARTSPRAPRSPDVDPGARGGRDGSASVDGWRAQASGLRGRRSGPRAHADGDEPDSASTTAVATDPVAPQPGSARDSLLRKEYSSPPGDVASRPTPARA